MITSGFSLRVSLLAFLIVVTCGFSLKGSKSTQQSSSDANDAAANFAYQGVATGHFTPVSFSAPGDDVMPVLLQEPPPPQFVIAADPALGRLSDAMPEVGFFGMHVPVQAEHVAASQPGPAQPGLPETKWTIEPSLFEALPDNQALGSSDFLPPPPEPPLQPALQSGEKASVVKEAEVGNYQRQTEEFGYPDEPLASGQGFASVVVPASGLGGFLGFPYPGYDYWLLYGKYPPGTYTTFSKHHEKGTDFSQDIHYLREHADDGQGPVQQKKVFQVAF